MSLLPELKKRNTKYELAPCYKDFIENSLKAVAEFSRAVDIHIYRADISTDSPIKMWIGAPSSRGYWFRNNIRNLPFGTFLCTVVDFLTKVLDDDIWRFVTHVIIQDEKEVGCAMSYKWSK